MAVISQVRVLQRIWRGYDDPGLPVGMWVSSTSVLGDASGGNISIEVIFRGANQAVTGRFYNIEQIAVVKTGMAASGGIQYLNFEEPGPTGLVNFEDRLRLDPAVGQFGQALTPSNSVRLPVFLGSTQAVPGIATVVAISFLNAIGETLAARLQGYIWEARSVMAEGGLRRPLDSLYG